jgi:hypothetical protein
MRKNRLDEIRHQLLERVAAVPLAVVYEPVSEVRTADYHCECALPLAISATGGPWVGMGHAVIAGIHDRCFRNIVLDFGYGYLL